MPYCVYTDVTAIITTTLTPAQITAIIAESDAEIDLRLGAQTAGDKVIQKLSKLMTAMQVKTQQPTSMSVGEYSESHNPVPVWQAEVDRIFALKRTARMKASSYQHIDEDDRYQEELRE